MDAYDLNVCIAKSRGVETLERVCKLAMEIGYTGIAVETSLPIPEGVEKQGFLLLRRVTLSLPNAAGLRSVAARQRRRVDLLAVHGRTKPICMSAAQTSTVDILMLRDLNDFGIFNSRIAHTLAKHDKPVEICLGKLLLFDGSRRSKMMRSMTQAVEYALHAKCPLIITSGATTPYGLRSPRDLAALALLAGVPEDLAMRGVHETPTSLISRIRGGKEVPCKSSHEAKGAD